MSTPPSSRPAPVTAAEIARLAGVTRATVSNWRRRHPNFPAPSGGNDTSPTYDLHAVRAWLAARNQLPARSPATELQLALRSVAGDAPGTSRLLPLVLAASRCSEDELTELTSAPDDHAMAVEAERAVRRHAADVPGAEDVSFDPEDAPLLRAVLGQVDADGAVATINALTSRGLDRTGSYPTPAPVAELMADLLADNPAGPASRARAASRAGASRRSDAPAAVLDPACGGGGLLLAAAHRGAGKVYGQDDDPDRATLAAVRLAVAAATSLATVHAGDSLRTDAFADLTVPGVLCNPPYNSRDWGHDELAYDPRWEYGFPPNSESELAWVQHCLAHLDPGGTAVLLLPPGPSWRQAGRRVRAELVRHGALRAVMALPAGSAPPQHIPLHLWLLRRPEPDTNPPTNVLFVDATDLGPAEPTVSSTYRRTTAKDLAESKAAILTAWRRYRADPAGFEPLAGVARAVPVVDLLDEAVDLNPTRHVRTEVAPERYAESATTLVAKLRASADELAGLVAGIGWDRAGDDPVEWRYATVSDLLRGGALALVRDTDEVRAGDVVVPEFRTRRPEAAGVIGADDLAGPTGARSAVPRGAVLRADPQRFDPWFLAGFLGAEDNLNAAATGTTIVRVDVRRLRVPLLQPDEQRRYGTAFRHLHELRSAGAQAGRLAGETASVLASGLTGGALLPTVPRGRMK